MTAWRKSSYSPDSSNCVAVGHGVGIRDTKAPEVYMPVGASAWAAFLSAAKSGALEPFDALD